jgi:hypothetical protein
MKYPIKPQAAYQIFKNGDMSQATIESELMSIDELLAVGIEVRWTGSPVGKFEVFATVSGDPAGWFKMDLADMDCTVPEKIFGIPIQGVPYNGLKLVYTRTSGSGTLQAFAIGKA